MIKPGTMHKYFPKNIRAKKKKRFGIGHVLMDKEGVEYRQIHESFSETYDLEPGLYVVLYDNAPTELCNIIMSDTPMEIRTNREFIEKAHGDVLIAGLGLGIVVLSIQEKKEVESITVIELYSELVDLVVPRIPLNGKVKIVTGDIFEWLPAEGQKFDTIYFDIWNDISGDNLPQTIMLHRRFKKYLNRKDNPEAWMNSWRRVDFRRMYFEGLSCSQSKML